MPNLGQERWYGVCTSVRDLTGLTAGESQTSMANHNVYIGTDSHAGYDPDDDPNPRLILGDTVTFILRDRSDEVVVNFDTTSPLTVDHVPLGGTHLNASQPCSVRSEVGNGFYTFTATPVIHSPSNVLEQPGTVSGGLDVSTDPRPPPPPPDSFRSGKK